MKTKGQIFTYLASILLLIMASLVPTATLWADTMEEVAPSPLSIATVQSTYGKLPFSFEANHGQWDSSVQFVTRRPGHTLFLTPSTAVLTLRAGKGKAERGAENITQYKSLRSPSPISHSVVRMSFAGADPQAEVVGLDPLPGIVNYFIGDDPSKWRTNIPTYEKVGYKDLYPGIDLVYYGNQGQLEYDLVVAPGADPNQITLTFDGAEQIAVDEQGDLILTLPQSSNETAESAATLRLHKPVIYQKDEQGEKHLLAGGYVLKAATAQQAVALHPGKTTQVAFQLASYDVNRPLIIDPVLSWATYLGGSSQESGRGIAVDQAGNAYVTGETLSSDFPGTAGSAIQSALGGIADAFVTKFNAAGTEILYSIYLGGSDWDQGDGIAVDAVGNAYVTGLTLSSNFPGTAGSAIQSALGGAMDAFVTKLNATGTALVYSTYLGGNRDDVGNGIAVDEAGTAYVTGETSSSNFPGTAGSAIQSTLSGSNDAFVAKLNAAGTVLAYATYLGGSGLDLGLGIAVDTAGNAYVTGNTSSSNFPGTAGSLIQSTFGGGFEDAFVTKLNAAGTALVYSTYLGGNGVDVGFGITVDAAGTAYVTGTTGSSNFPGTAGSAIQSTLGGAMDAFVAKLNAAGTALVYSTYLGGSRNDGGNGIAVDTAGTAYVTGGTESSDFPGTAGSAIQSTLGGITDVFVAKITSNIPFAAFDARAKIELRHRRHYDELEARHGHHEDEFEGHHRRQKDEFDLTATFTLGPGSNGIAPLTEPVIIQVGTFSTAIPPGFFKQHKGRFVFEGRIHGVHLEAVLRSLILGNDYELKVEGQGADLTGTKNPVTVSVTIGDDSGSKAITAKIK